MAVKYTIPMRDDFDLLWRADIDMPGYSGDTIQLTGVGRTAMVAEWNGDVDEPYTPIISSKVTLQFYNEGNVDIVELQNLQDMEARVHVYRDNVLWWTGYVVPDGIQRNFRATPYPVQLVATDGLALLKDIPFNLPNNWPMPVGVSNRCPISFIRYVLYGANHLNQRLPLRWASEVKSVRYNDDFLFGTMEWGALGEAWNNPTLVEGGLDSSRSCMYILENMVKSIGARFFQFGGKWHLARINDITGGTYNWKELSTDTNTAPTLSEGTEDLTAGLNAVYYPFISEDHVITNKPALTDVVATYEHYQAENIIPNGGFDMVDTYYQIPFYWGFSDNPESAASFEAYDSLIPDNFGNSVQLSYPVTGTVDNRAIFTLIGGLPLDANLLFKRMTFGFTFMPLNGFPYQPYNPSDPDDPNANVINWDSHPLRVRMYYKAKDQQGVVRILYLNEYGYWQWEPDEGYLVQDSYNVTTGGGVRTHKISYSGYPKQGDVIRVFVDNSANILPDFLYEHSVTGTEQGDIDTMLSNFQAYLVSQGLVSATYSTTGPFSGYIQFTINDSFTATVHPSVTSGASTILPGNWIPISVNQMKIGDIASIVFQGKGGNSEILMPDPGLLDGHQSVDTGVLHIEFALLEGQRYVLDDVWIRVEENNDVYQSLNPGATRKSNRQNVSIGISTSFSGFFLSNYMTSYNKSNEEFLVTDGKHQSSLTGLLANAMMRFRYKPSQIFNGTIYTNGRDWKFHHMYMISALGNNLFLPMQSKYNIETCQVTLAVIEARDDENTFDEKHYASNDVIL
ncbi:hypothetical protein SAMN05421747_10414 [Parapedobacter composti]|uniref:Uncharacterized protein n=1 Tax=Parapedobacter composti TaxID=623281 RepID=A0A1I1G746_9SPHI|nr:hypothetical protein [Parapedobacter composti]SFC07404.1 hypothetical protein SAMN05421747_10414 [Parapedobacter composti]